MNRRAFLRFWGALPLGRLWTGQTANRFSFPPTVQRLTETSALIHGGLVNATGSHELWVTTDEEPARRYLLPDTAPYFQLLIDDLSPATIYTYAVVSDGMPVAGFDGSAWGPTTFTTPPYERPLRVVAVGDSGWGDTITRGLAAHMAGQEPHYLLHLGDALYNSLDDYRGDPFANWWHKYYAAFAPVLATTPHGLTFGNHDLESKLADGSRSYDAAYPPQDTESDGRWHSFVLENIRFICLDSQVYFSFPALIEAQEAWLDEQLANPEGLYTVVYFHVPPYQSSQERQSDSALIAARWGWRFAQSDHVRLVLSGHVHAYERLSVDGVTYVIAGGGGQTLYAQGEPHPNSQIFRRLASYVMLDLEPDGFTITAFDTAGNIIDQTAETI